MKTLTWFTHTNIDTRKITSRTDLLTLKDSPSASFDLSEFIEVFTKSEIWTKGKYRNEYINNFDKTDIDKIKSIRINLHSNNGPYSNFHNYEKVLKSYINLDSIEKSKISSSGISDASQIAVVVVEYDSENNVIDNLTYEEEKDVEIVYDKLISEQNAISYRELKRIKSIVCEFIQFFNFNIHLNFLTHDYEFSFTDKPNLTGFTTVSENDSLFYETDKIDFFAHYIFYEKDKDNLLELLSATSKFWHKEIPTIHFFLDALKGDFITATNFIKLVFTVESFFGNNTSTDFMALSISQILGKSIGEMKSIREKLKLSFTFRNEIVHGGKIHQITNKSTFKNLNTSELFFELKNIIIQLFYFYINKGLYLSKVNEKINHELIFNTLGKKQK